MSARTAVITGGSSGLGATCAGRLAADGYRVVTLDIGAGADFVVDVCDSASVAQVADEIGAVSVLVNSAGIVGPNKPFWDVTDDEWDTTFAVNTRGTFAMMRAFVPGMIAAGWGRIVNIASIAGKEGNPGIATYSASKAAVIGMTKAMGKELALTGVLVNAVAPAVIATPMNATTAPEVLERLVNMIPMRRVGRADEVASLVSWLASEECSFSTGAVYDISGGRATY